MLNVAMFGASGRMGRTLIPLVVASTDLRLTGALAAADDAHIGHDAGVVAGAAPVAISITSDPERALEGADVAIDFTLPAVSLEHARRCLVHKVPLVIGTTGHDDQARAEIARIAGKLPVVMAPNMSLGVNLLFKLAELGARALDAEYDIEIFEAHHRHKVDAPSGTALGLGHAVARGRGATLELQRDAWRRDRRRSPRLFRGSGRADRTRAPRAGPLRLRSWRAGRCPLGRRPAAGALLDDGCAGAVERRACAIAARGHLSW